MRDLQYSSSFRLLSGTSSDLPSNLPRCRHQVLLQSQHCHSTTRVKSSASPGSNSCSSTANRGKAWTASSAVRCHQRWTEADEPLPRERSQGRVKAWDCNGESSEHNCQTETQLLCHHESTWKSWTVLLVQAMLQAWRRHRWDFRFLTTYYPMCAIVRNSAMRGNSCWEAGSQRFQRCQRCDGQDHEFYQAPWDLHWTSANSDDSSDSPSRDAVIHNRSGGSSVETSLPVCHNDEWRFNAQWWTHGRRLARAEEHRHRDDGLESSNNDLLNEPHPDFPRTFPKLWRFPHVKIKTGSKQ